jgi:hypothetical protein
MTKIVPNEKSRQSRKFKAQLDKLCWMERKSSKNKAEMARQAMSTLYHFH